MVGQYLIGRVQANEPNLYMGPLSIIERMENNCVTYVEIDSGKKGTFNDEEAKKAIDRFIVVNETLHVARGLAMLKYY